MPRKPSKASLKAAADRAEKRSKGEEVRPEPTPLDPPEVAEARHPGGRPTLYKPEFAAVAKALCKRGATDYDLAAEFDVNVSTIWRWQVQYDEFCSALCVGKDAYDDRVERSLAQRAVGYTYNAEKVFCFQGSITRAETTEHVPPDPGAAKLWLTNRRPKEWRDVSRHEMTGRDGGAIETKETSNLELARKVAFMLGQAVGRGKVAASDATSAS